MDNLHNNGKLYRDEYVEKKIFHDVVRTHGQGVREKIIQQEVKSNRKQDKVKVEVKLAVMKGDTTCLGVLECIIYYTNLVHII